MPQINRHALVRHSAKRMFDLVNAVERYPAWFAWCSSSEVLEQSDELMRARLELRIAGVRSAFTTRGPGSVRGPTGQIRHKNVSKPLTRANQTDRSAGYAGLLRVRERLVGVVPVHQLIEESVDVFGAEVLVIEVIGVLPDIHG